MPELTPHSLALNISSGTSDKWSETNSTIVSSFVRDFLSLYLACDYVMVKMKWLLIKQVGL